MIKINYTAFLINDWKSIVHSHFERIKKRICSKYETTINIFSFPHRDELLEIFDNIGICVNIYEQTENLYEYPALIDLAKNPCEFNLYFHTKGVSRTYGCKTAKCWNEYMTYFIIERSDECIKCLKNGECDCVGCEFHEHPFPHYSGNFWWCTGNHVKNVANSKYFDDFTNRLNAEKIVASVPGKYMSLCESGLDLYHNIFDRASWIENKHTFYINI